MLWHAIAPSRRYTKASHDVVRHPRLSSDAKVLILYVQGLPDGGTDLALSEHARKLDIKGRAYQRAKEQLLLCGFVHERRVMGERGRWVTQQVFSNVPLADAEVSPLWCDAGVGAAPSPSARFPTVGQPGPRTVGHQLPVDEEREKKYSRPPTEALGAVADLELLTAEEVQAERVLLSLRHVSRGLHLGVGEARALVAQAVEWLRRGVSVGELRRVLSSDLPEGGVRSAVGFLRHRLTQKMPEATVPAAREVQPMPMPMPMPMQEQEPEPAGSDTAPPPAVPRYVPPLVTCPGPGPEHVFRAMAGETECPDSPAGRRLGPLGRAPYRRPRGRCRRLAGAGTGTGTGTAQRVAGAAGRCHRCCHRPPGAGAGGVVASRRGHACARRRTRRCRARGWDRVEASRVSP